jgi:hypothetical protein
MRRSGILELKKSDNIEYILTHNPTFGIYELTDALNMRLGNKVNATIEVDGNSVFNAKGKIGIRRNMVTNLNTMFVGSTCIDRVLQQYIGKRITVSLERSDGKEGRES